MRSASALAFFLLLATPLVVVSASAQTASLTGLVVDEDGQPLPGANVYIAGSQRGTVADAAGRFRLDRVPLGAHRLAASFVGYEAGAEDLVLRRPGETRTVDFRLRESAISMDEVTAEGERDEAWQRRFERFERRFLGETANAAETEILNPYVLDFEERRGTLTARAAEPLVIENRALGYRIHYALTDFEARSDYNFFHGEPLFEELEPNSPEEALRWQRARQAAYLGSFRHLSRALVAGDAEGHGFHLYLLPGSGPGAAFGGNRGGILGGRSGGRQNRFPTTPSEILSADGTEFVLAFRGLLEVVYTGEPEEPGFLEREWARERRAPASVQTSQLRFPIAEVSARLDRFGEELDPRSITVSGYMAYERFADALPKEFGLAESGIPGAAEAAEALRETR